MSFALETEVLYRIPVIALHRMLSNSDFLVSGVVCVIFLNSFEKHAVSLHERVLCKFLLPASYEVVVDIDYITSADIERILKLMSN